MQFIKGSNQTDQLQHEQLSKSCFHQLRKLKRWGSPLLNSPLSSLDSVLRSILPGTPISRRNPFAAATRAWNPEGQHDVQMPNQCSADFPPMSVSPSVKRHMATQEGASSPRGGKGPHFSAWESGDQGRRVRNSPQLAVQHQGWTRDVLVPNLVIALTTKASEKGKD